MADQTRTARIASVVAATGIAFACGTNYAYSAWAPDFATRMQLTATESNAIGAAGNVGAYAMGIPAGILIDNRGPRMGVLVGAIALAAGYFPIHKAYDAGPGSVSVGVLSFFSFLTGTGSCTAFSAAIKTAAYNWPLHRGTATALPLAAFGLSAFMFTTIANLAFDDSPSNYLLMLAVGTLVLNAVSIIFIRLIPTDTRDDGSEDGRGRSSSRLRYTSDRADGHSEDAEPTEGDTLVSRASTAEDFGADEEWAKHSAQEEKSVELTGTALLKEFKFWQLFLMLGLLSGVGLMTINNIGNDAASLWRAYDPSKPRSFVRGREQMHVSILSICSSLGRLASGIGSDILIKRLHASRIWCLTTSASLFALAQLLALLITNPNFLFLVSSITGLAYGALFGVFPSITADAFGVQGLSLNWGFVIFAPVLSGNVYNLAYGRILDRNKGGAPECLKGLGCYASAYWVTLASSLAGAVLSVWCIRYEALARRRKAGMGKGVLARES